MTAAVILAFLAGALTVAVLACWLLRDPADYTRDPLVADHMRTLRVHGLEPVEGCPLCAHDVTGAEALSPSSPDTGRDRSIEPPPSAAPVTLTTTAGVATVLTSIDLALGSVSLDAEPNAFELAQAEQDIYDAFHIDRGSQA